MCDLQHIPGLLQRDLLRGLRTAVLPGSLFGALLRQGSDEELGGAPHEASGVAREGGIQAGRDFPALAIRVACARGFLGAVVPWQW